MAPAQFTAALFSRFGRWSSRFRSPDPETLSAGELGVLGEKLAARHLGRSGYRVIFRNFRAPHGGEVDIVCRDKRERTLVFVEVKTRRSIDFGRPGDAVNADKQKLIARGAIGWLRLLSFPDIRYRFDIAEVVFSGPDHHVNIIRNAFSLPEHYRL